MPKIFWQSKTIWFNALSIALLLVDYSRGRHLIAPDTALLLVSAGNLFLRAITSQPITLAPGGK